MRCRDAQKLSSDYLDGELAPDASAAVRGHLRTCTACELYFAQEAELIEAAASLATLEPPDSIWEGIQARIASAEVQDAKGGVLRRWLRRRSRPIALTGAAVLVAAAALIIASPWKHQPRSQRADSRSQMETGKHSLEPTFEEERAAQLAESDRHYIESIAELRELVEEDRSAWGADEAEAIDAQLASFHRTAIGQRLNLSGGEDASSPDTMGRATLYAGYRAEIAFLQSTLAGDFSERR